MNETRACVKITPRAWGDFHVGSRFPRSTIPEEKWETTRSLQQSKRERDTVQYYNFDTFK